MDHFNDFWNMKDNFTFVVFVWKRATRAFFEIFPSVFYGRNKIKQVWNEGKWWPNVHYGVNTLIKCFQSISTPAESFEGLQCHWPEVLLTWGWVKDRPPAVYRMERSRRQMNHSTWRWKKRRWRKRRSDQSEEILGRDKKTWCRGRCGRGPGKSSESCLEANEIFCPLSFLFLFRFTWMHRLTLSCAY